MTETFEQVLRRHAETMREKTASQIVYRYTDLNGDSAEAQVLAIPTVYRPENQDEVQGQYYQMMRRDFIIVTADLPTTPVRGDVIEFAGASYEVVPLDDEQVFIFTESYGSAMRIHTQKL